VNEPDHRVNVRAIMVEVRLTYDELGRRLGIKPEAARQRAKRRQREGRWRVVVDNTGRAIVYVEEADLAAEPPVRTVDDRANVRPNAHERPPDHRPDDRPELVVELRARIRALEVEREALIEAGDRLIDDLGEARERAARTEGRAETLERALEDLAGRLDRASDELRDLRRPWWRRLFG
jgi:hypothetical protein